MIDPDILDSFGSNKHAIRKLFTAEPTSDLGKLRKAFEERIEGRINEGIAFNLRNYRLYAASDLAWDSQPITKEVVPLMLYAQGKIDFKAFTQQLKDVSPETLKKFCEIDETSKEIKAVSLSKFHEVWVNLVRSYVTRRTASLAVDRTKLYPFLKYDPFSTSFVAKLRADVLSQRIEMMTNQYGYRHDLPQATRDMLLYAHTLEFPCGAWESQKQLFKKKRAEGFDTSDDKKFEVEARVIREGVPFVRPHPTRTFADTAYPLASLNTDTGVTFVAYWNVLRFREVEKNTDYFNRDKVAFTGNTTVALLKSNASYFELYFPGAAVNFPTADAGSDVAAANDREQNIGRYSGEMGDRAITLVDYRERVIPKDVGLGDYPYPVWLRLVVAGTTVVYGEFLPSLPAIYYGYNEDDSRQVNSAFAHEIFPWQDQASNMLTQLLCTQKTGLIKVICANIDVLTPEMLKELRAILKGERYTAGPMLLEYKGEQLESLGLKTEDVFKLHEANMLSDISVFFRSIVQLLSLAERVLNVSAQELGQTSSHELSATETAEIANTTNVLSSYIGLGLDEALAAKKKLLYEALIAMGQDKVYVPVVNRYLPGTIKAAGFEVVKEADEGDTRENYADDGKPKSVTVTGSKQSLIYDYSFTSRDGAERMSNAKSAEVMVNLLSQLVNIPGLLQDMGKEKLYQLINHIVRMSGAGVDLIFDLKEGEPETLPSGDQAQDNKKEIQDVIRQILDALQADRQKIAQLEQALGGAPSPATPPPGGPAPMAGAPPPPPPAQPMSAMPAMAGMGMT